jgi:hypothetical protein
MSGKVRLFVFATNTDLNARRVRKLFIKEEVGDRNIVQDNDE